MSRNRYLQECGLSLLIVPGYVTEWVAEAWARELSGENRLSHFEGIFHLRSKVREKCDTVEATKRGE